MKKSYFKLYQSLFENESYVTQTTEMQKVLHFLLICEDGIAKYNLKDSFSRTHFWLAGALSVERQKISPRLKQLREMGLVEYTSGYYNKNGGVVPTTFRQVTYGESREGEVFAEIDRFTFLSMLDMVANGFIKHAHIIVYCAFKLYANFGEIKTTKLSKSTGIGRKRLKPIVEDLNRLGLLKVEIKHGKFLILGVITFNHNRLKEKELRDRIKERSGDYRAKEKPSKDFENEQAQTLEEVVQLFKFCYQKNHRLNPPIPESHRDTLAKMDVPMSDLDSMVRAFFEQGVPKQKQTFALFVNKVFMHHYSIKKKEEITS